MGGYLKKADGISWRLGIMWPHVFLAYEFPDLGNHEASSVILD